MPEMQVDLTNCDREPIHLLGRVQSYGALLAVGADWQVQHASANLGAILGVEAAAALGRPLSEVIDTDAVTRLRRSLRAVEDSSNAVRLFGVAVRAGLGPFDVSIHQSSGRLLVELEPKGRGVESDVMAEVQPLVRRIRFDRALDTLSRDAARSLRVLSGFDSVMVYRFDRDGSGQVIAEDRADGQRRYLGQHFPATDIPKQARALYKRSLLRLIADVGDPGAPILAHPDQGEAPLDLSLAVTRAVSPIHIEYLNNMGIGASMSVSIMKDGELWGLFACHHDRPHYIDYERRTAVEMFGHMFSYEIGRYEESLRRKATEDAARLQTRLMSQLADAHELSGPILSMSDAIQGVIAHDGMAVVWDGKVAARGAVPPEDEIRAFGETFADLSQGYGEVTAVESLALHRPAAAAYAKDCAGSLFVPISRGAGDYIVFFRREIEAVMEWAGDPSKPVSVGPNGIRLTPRESFAIWRETVLGHCADWSDYAIHAAGELRTLMLEVVLKVAEAQATERKRAAEQQQLLISELNHRVRNILNLMRGLVAQSKSGTTTLSEFTESLDGRIHALAQAHDQLTRESWEPASLRELLRLEFDAYADAKAERVRITGPDAMILPTAYTALALVLHEMATNSIKYGALCDRAGRVDIALSFDAAGTLTIDWKERGGPAVAPPRRRGFGTTIIERSIPHELRGTARIDYRVTGVEALFTVPGTFASRAAGAPDEGAEEGAAPGAVGGAIPAVSPAQSGDGRLQGRGLVVEDSLIIALDAADALQDLGAEDVQIASSVAQALEMIETRPPAFALLDVNLGSEQSVPVAERLAALGVPFVLATGYGEASALVEAYPPCVIVQKPFSPETLTGAFAKALRAG
ncbi:HWE histidine kinase domain-containing protein [Acidimangrovimonas sediminis]|uniref:HWE histidine kinase domain-containing protein n=1 Tax=Acidimangrovimonas sediminis TaxID=2056283 RepID=UPI000C80EAAE|nr:HWE histidine kinase domain-containing protein [Acidimangrovimonas sediminis]